MMFKKTVLVCVADGYFNKGDTISFGNSITGKVIKTYKHTWLRKLLKKIFKKIRIDGEHCKFIKVKY